MISLILPPKDQISRVQRMLAEEFGTASNIKSRVNRLSPCQCFNSKDCQFLAPSRLCSKDSSFTREVRGLCLPLIVSVPPNGLVLYCGTIVTDEGKEKKVNIDFEPFKAINTSLYLCDNKFHTEVCTIGSVVVTIGIGITSLG